MSFRLQEAKCLMYLFLVPKDGLKSHSLFEEIRMTYIKELGKAIVKREGSSSQNWQRFYQLTKLMDTMHEVSYSGGIYITCKIRLAVYALQRSYFIHKNMDHEIQI